MLFVMRFNLAVKGFKLLATCIKSGGMTKVIIVMIIMLGGAFYVYMYVAINPAFLFV